MTPINSWNSEYAVLSHRTTIKVDSISAPIGSIHQRSLLPPTDVRIPKPLMRRSLRWSSQRIRTCEYWFRRAQQYRNKLNLVAKAMHTAMTEGMWKPKVSSVCPSASSRQENAMRMNDTAVIRKQKQMFPAVSMRALPAGNLRGSTRWTALWQSSRVRFERGSKTESAMVVKRDRDLEATAA